MTEQKNDSLDHFASEEIDEMKEAIKVVGEYDDLDTYLESESLKIEFNFKACGVEGDAENISAKLSLNTFGFCLGGGNLIPLSMGLGKGCIDLNFLAFF